MSKAVGQTIWDGISHLPPISSTEFAVEKVIPAFSEYFAQQERADWDAVSIVNVEMDNTIMKKLVTEDGVKSVAQSCTSNAVGAATQVFFSMPFAIWNGVLGSTKVVVALIAGHSGTVERKKAQDTLQQGLYMGMVAVADLMIAAAIFTIVIPIGYITYMFLHPGSSMKQQSNDLIGDFERPIRKDTEVEKVSYIQGMAYRGMQIILP